MDKDEIEFNNLIKKIGFQRAKQLFIKYMIERKQRERDLVVKETIQEMRIDHGGYGIREEEH